MKSSLPRRIKKKYFSISLTWLSFQVKLSSIMGFFVVNFEMQLEVFSSTRISVSSICKNVQYGHTFNICNKALLYIKKKIATEIQNIL